LIDTQRVVNGKHYVYLTGWADNQTSSFTIARSSVAIGDKQPITPPTNIDIISLVEVNCYDQYNEIRHPKMFLTTSSLYVIVQGFCSFILKINLNDTNDFSNYSYFLYNLTQNSPRVVTSIVLDTQTEYLYFTSKDSSSPYVKIIQLMFNSFTEIPLQTLTDMEPGAEVSLVLAEIPTKYLIAVGAFTNVLLRFEILNTTLINKAYAYLPDSLKLLRLFSTYYYAPHLYIATYTPAAQIARINMNSFCSNWCSYNGYCLAGTCTCMSGYYPDPTQICVSPPTQVINYQSEEVGLSVVVALLCISNIIFIFLWYRSRRNTYSAVS